MYYVSIKFLFTAKYEILNAVTHCTPGSALLTGVITLASSNILNADEFEVPMFWQVL